MILKYIHPAYIPEHIWMLVSQPRSLFADSGSVSGTGAYISDCYANGGEP